MAYSKQNFQNGQILNATNLEKMENGIIAGQGAENLLDNSNFRDPVNSRGKNTYSDASNEYTIDRWKTQSGTNISIENGHINIIGQGELYQIIQNPKDGIYTFAARIRINSVGQFTPIMGVNNGGNTGRQINLDADIGEWKTYILQYDLSSMTAETIKFLLSPRGGNTTASISVEWAAMYKGAYTANTLPAYVPKGKHVEMLNCGVSLQPHNLFDNSDFRDPVNSRGITSTEASGYHIDKWKKENESGKVTVGNGYLSMTGTGAYWFLTQYIEPKKIKSGAVYTIALADTSGSISVCSTVMSTSMTKFTARHTFTSGAVVITNVEYASDKYSIYFTSNSSKETRFAWAALYEGSYTAGTLPPYIPKGKHIEMLNCGVPLALHNLLDNSDFRDPVNQRGKTSYSTNGNEYTIDRWKTQYGTGLTIENGYINIIGAWQIYQILKNPKDGVYTFAAEIRVNSIGDNQPNIYISDGTECLLDAPIGQWKTYILQYDLSSIESDNISFSLCSRGGNNSNASISARWAAMYKGAYDASTLPPYAPKGKHVEMLNCGVPLQPHNLLDNSDFTNPVNQRGKTSYSGGEYAIDRWEMQSGTNMTLMDGFIRITGDWDAQQIIGNKLIGTYTFAAYARVNVAGEYKQTIELFENNSSIASCMCTNVGEWKIYTCTATFTGAVNQIVIINNRAGSVSDASMDVQWAALYEGSYTADTIPPYVPKGKRIEMLNCGVPLQPRNLLDNSDFADIVSQAGLNGSHDGTAYIADRWIGHVDITPTANTNGILLTTTNHYAFIQQRVKVTRGKTYTLALSTTGGTTMQRIAVFNIGLTEIFASVEGSNSVIIATFEAVYDDMAMLFYPGYTDNGGSAVFQWAALYEGSYDASTLPPYVPKGKHVEMVNCGVPLQPHNLLDNSNFRNYINQRGEISTAGVWNYCIDRWRAIGTAGQLVWHNSDHVALGALRGISQAIENKSRFVGKTYTLAAEDTGGALYITSGTYGGDDKHIWKETNGMELRLYSVSDDNNIYFSLKNLSSDTSKFIYLKWAALYEGSYTASTLPAYQPKGYATELAECQRYFERIGSAESVTLGNAVYVGSGAKAFVFSIKYAPKRLKSPSVTFSDVSNYRVLFQDAVNASTYGASGITAIDDIMAENPYARFRVSVSSAIDTNSWAALQRQDGAQNAYIDISADL